MFRNISEKETYYTEWNDIDIIYHVNTMLSADAHRRLIGNDVAIIFFKEKGTPPFDLLTVDTPRPDGVLPTAASRSKEYSFLTEFSHG